MSKTLFTAGGQHAFSYNKQTDKQAASFISFYSNDAKQNSEVLLWLIVVIHIWWYRVGVFKSQTYYLSHFYLRKSFSVVSELQFPWLFLVDELGTVMLPGMSAVVPVFKPAFVYILANCHH